MNYSESFCYIHKEKTMRNSSLYRHIGEKIHQKREEYGLTLSQAAKILDIEEKDLLAYEAGNKEIYPQDFEKFRRVFKADIDYYFQGLE